QLVPEFKVSQHERNRHVLEMVRRVIGCGYLKPNHKNSQDKTWVLVVRSRKDLIEKVIPFFERYPLRTTKSQDFEKFAYIVRKMEEKEHLHPEGFRKLLKIALQMNNHGKYRRTGKHKLQTSSGTLRDCTPDTLS
ncbi:MAG: LAGLIDADG family homing endonuclease, partial [Aquificaceae bacterium]